MRPERVFGRTFEFANIENAQAFFNLATKMTSAYSKFVDITLTGTVVRVDIKVDSVGEEIYQALSTQLLAAASNFA